MYSKKFREALIKGVNNLRILFATYWYLPHIGGVNTYINVLRKELINEGHHVDVLAHHTENNDKIYMLTTGQYVEKGKILNELYNSIFNYYEKKMPYVKNWIRYREIERYAFEYAASQFNLDQYDLIHAQDIISTRALKRVKPPNVPLISTIHGLLATEHVVNGSITSRNSISWRYVVAEEYYGATSAEKTIVPTNWLKNSLSKRPFNVLNKNIHTIPYGIDIEQFSEKFHSPSNEPLPEIDENKTIFICPARLVKVKGHKYLLEAMANLKQTRKDFVLWIVGDGPLSGKLKDLSNKLDIDDVVNFLGYRTDVPQLLKLSDILILPSVQDNQPFSIMEAQIGGKLVVASEAGGIPEMINDGETGFLFPRRNSLALTKKLEYILSKPQITEKVAIQGQKWGLNQWSSKTLLEKTKKIYIQALENIN